jgi:hypothetical protein
MNAWMRLTLAAAMAAGVAACGSSGSSSCYDTLLASAQSCLPSATATGTMNDAGTSCSYTTGQQVSFTLPETDGISNFVLNSASGSLCMSYQDVDGGVRVIQTPGGTAVSNGGSITCPGGVDYTGSTAVGNVSAYGTSAASFDLVAADGGLTVFSCSN